MRNTMLNVRVSAELREALDRRAAGRGISVSELVRDLLERELASRPLGDRIGALKGSLDAPPAVAGWRRRIRDHNWRD